MANFEDFFRHDLKQFRLAHGLSRSDAAWSMGISPSTLRRWEDGSNLPQTASIWRVLQHIDESENTKRIAGIELNELKGVFETLASKMELSSINSNEQKSLKIEKNLSGSVLRAAQTDFRFDEAKRKIVPAQFAADLELFKGLNSSDIRNLLDSLKTSALEVIPDLERANLNSEYLKRHLEKYAEGCASNDPNPRFLQRRGEIIRQAVRSPNISSALNDWDKALLEGFVDDHNELMRRYFGETLERAQEVDAADINPSILDSAAELLTQVISAVNSHEHDASTHYDSKVAAIIWDVRDDLVDRTAEISKANSPEQRDGLTKQALTTVKHSVLIVGRLILRSMGALVSQGGNLGGLAYLVEMANPGTLRFVYEAFARVMPALPALPL